MRSLDKPEGRQFREVLENIRRIDEAYPDGIHTREELDRLEPGRRPARSERKD